VARRRTAIAAAVLVAAAALAATSNATPTQRAADRQGLALLVGQLPVAYEAADHTHDAARAEQIRRLTRIAQAEAVRLGAGPTAAALLRLERLLVATRVRLQPWPFVAQVRALSLAAARPLPRGEPGDEYSEIKTALEQLQTDVQAGDISGAEFQLAVASAHYQAGPAPRLQALDPSLAAEAAIRIDGLGRLLAAHALDSRIEKALGQVRDEVKLTAQTLGDVKTSRATIIGDAAVIVFREGLEAVLILAALTASFVGARRHLRRPVLLGALAGLVATALTWLAAQTIIHSLSSGGMRLQAITGLLAIGVLLLVTNWFFHRIYWSEWIGRFNRRRKVLEHLGGGRGILSGQLLGFVLLGLTSTYREGFETVLFLQTLQVSAGTGTTMIGVGIGLAATVLVGLVTFLLQRKLPYKRMLIVTGVLIALVLAIMTGTTVHAMQGLGWVAITDTPFRTPFWATTWLGLYPTWQTIGAQLGSLAFVIGSYTVSRQLQLQKRRRHEGYRPQPGEPVELS
jgi:high-affinity iron transporter